jgi:NhaA family Na+:H+ antiporter
MSERQRLSEFLRSEAVGGGALIAAAIAGIVLASGPLAELFRSIAETRIGPAQLHLDLTIQEWTSDGLLVIFFFIIGCELKQELVLGSLATPAQAALPIAAAIGGMVLPAALFVLLNAHEAANLIGWGVPMATDIAFALAILAVFGRGLPVGVRAFLLTLAVVDDLGAILVIALFYSGSIEVGWLIVALLAFAAYAVAQRLRLTHVLIYLPLALCAWLAVHNAGIHPTVAGVVLGLLTRVRRDPREERAPAARVSRRLHPFSAGVAVPSFALFAAGVDLRTLSGAAQIDSPIFLGIVVGLFVGKPLGIFITARLMAALAGARLPNGVEWIDIAIVGTLGGIGFTVALLIGELAFTEPASLGAAKVGVLAASFMAAALSAIVLRVRTRSRRAVPRRRR